MAETRIAHGKLRRTAARVALALVTCALAATLTAAHGAGAGTRPREWRAPARLADTGLYSHFASRTIDPRNLAYSPQYPLWSDGASKRRWIFLPPGTAVDARDPEAWKFPVGTKIWKEFSWGRRVETRYLENTRQGWRYAAYEWRDDESDAILASESGSLTRYEIAPGKPHRLPSIADCKSCHQGGRAEVLGFGALQLSPDRDPLAPNREALQPGMVTLDTLVRRGLVRGFPADLLTPPPRVHSPTPRGRAAIGYLHANCANCHDSVGPLATLGVDLHHALRARDAAEQPAALAIGHPSRFKVSRKPGAKSVWIEPGSPATSAVAVRMASRNAIVQMPPLGTQLVDEAALEIIREWIEQDLRPPSDTGMHSSTSKGAHE